MNNQFAVVFPGQGSQTPGMLKDIAEHFSEVKQVFDSASAALNEDLWEITQSDAEKLNQTAYTQPALLAASYAIWRILQPRFKSHPAMLAGHSLGEYTALVCADAINFRDAIKLVAARGQYMQAAVTAGTGAMAAIVGLDNDLVESICQHAQLANEILSPANFNSIGQVVIAGHKASVEKALIEAKAQGAKLATLLAVSVPSHCALMQPAAVALEKLLANTVIQIPTISVIKNIDATPYLDAEDIRAGLVQQLSQPVRWVQTIQYMVAQDIQTIIECGPGKVLSGLNKRIDKQLALSTTNDLASLSNLIKCEGQGA